MKLKSLIIALGLLFVTSSSAWADGTAISGSVAKGESDSIAYSIGLYQYYEPWFSGALGELSPTLELSGHYWDANKDHGEDVWGATMAPGLRFRLFTDGGFNPYLGASVGGTVISEDSIGPRKLGSHALFRTKGVLGIEFGSANQHRIQGEYSRYSTWGLTKNDDGYDTIGGSYSFAF